MARWAHLREKPVVVYCQIATFVVSSVVSRMQIEAVRAYIFPLHLLWFWLWYRSMYFPTGLYLEWIGVNHAAQVPLQCHYRPGIWIIETISSTHTDWSFKRQHLQICRLLTNLLFPSFLSFLLYPTAQLPPGISILSLNFDWFFLFSFLKMSSGSSRTHLNKSISSTRHLLPAVKPDIPLAHSIQAPAHGFLSWTFGRGTVVSTIVAWMCVFFSISDENSVYYRYGTSGLQ